MDGSDHDGDHDSDQDEDREKDAMHDAMHDTTHDAMYEKLPGYTEELRPEFHSTGTDFRVMLKNANFNLVTEGQDESQDRGQVEGQVTTFDVLIDFCSVPRTRSEMMALTPIQSVTNFRKTTLLPLLESGKIKITIPDKPNSKNISRQNEPIGNDNLSRRTSRQTKSAGFKNPALFVWVFANWRL